MAEADFYQIQPLIEELKLLQPTIVTLNVGGEIMTTTRETLNKCPDSKLAGIFESDVFHGVDDRGRVVIDRDGKLFRYVLNFLRDSKLCLPRDFKEHKALTAEAEFFKLPALVEEIKKVDKPEAGHIFEVVRENDPEVETSLILVRGSWEESGHVPLHVKNQIFSGFQPWRNRNQMTLACAMKSFGATFITRYSEEKPNFRRTGGKPLVCNIERWFVPSRLLRGPKPGEMSDY